MMRTVAWGLFALADLVVLLLGLIVLYFYATDLGHLRSWNAGPRAPLPVAGHGHAGTHYLALGVSLGLLLLTGALVAWR